MFNVYNCIAWEHSGEKLVKLMILFFRPCVALVISRGNLLKNLNNSILFKTDCKMGCILLLYWLSSVQPEIYIVQVMLTGWPKSYKSKISSVELNVDVFLWKAKWVTQLTWTCLAHMSTDCCACLD